jgi:hypothetical protein
MPTGRLAGFSGRTAKVAERGLGDKILSADTRRFSLLGILVTGDGRAGKPVARKGRPMTQRAATNVSMGFVLAGTLLMMSMAFDILPMNIALFAGTGCFVASGFVYGFLRPKPPDRPFSRSRIPPTGSPPSEPEA